MYIQSFLQCLAVSLLFVAKGAQTIQITHQRRSSGHDLRKSTLYQARDASTTVSGGSNNEGEVCYLKRETVLRDEVANCSLAPFVLTQLGTRTNCCACRI